MIQIAALLFLAIAGYGQTKEGFIDVPGGPVWYRISGASHGIPLLVLHGGPGGTSCANLELEKLTGQQIIFYDQLGSGRSGRPSDQRLWNVERFVEELHAVRKKLGLKRMHLMGHSWGGSLAAAYVLAKGTQGIESLILASPLLSTKDWIADADELRKQLPEEAQSTLRRHEAAGTTDSAEYRAAEGEYTARFINRKGNKPKCAGSVFNEVIYNQMWGPSEFYATGSLKHFDVTRRLNELKVRVLLIAGEFDEARPTTLARYQKLISGSKLVVVPDAGHAIMADNPGATLNALSSFLKQTL